MRKSRLQLRIRLSIQLEYSTAALELDASRLPLLDAAAGRSFESSNAKQLNVMSVVLIRRLPDSFSGTPEAEDCQSKRRQHASHGEIDDAE